MLCIINGRCNKNISIVSFHSVQVAAIYVDAISITNCSGGCKFNAYSCAAAGSFAILFSSLPMSYFDTKGSYNIFGFIVYIAEKHK